MSKATLSATWSSRARISALHALSCLFLALLFSSAYAQEGQSRPASYRLQGYLAPALYQEDSGACLYFAAKGMASYLLSKAKGIFSPAPDSDTDVSVSYLNSFYTDERVQNPITDIVDFIPLNGNRYVLERDYGFTGGWFYKTVDWSPYYHAADFPRYGKNVLFSSPLRQTPQGVRPNYEYADKVTTPDGRTLDPESKLETLKRALWTVRTPIVLVWDFKGTTGVNSQGQTVWTNPPYYHVDLVIGYDDAKGMLTMWDSKFSGETAYDGFQQINGKKYASPYQMPYDNVRLMATHATQYFLN